MQKRRWGSCWSLYWCFGSLKSKKRIGHAVLAPEAVAPAPDAPGAENPIQASTSALPFVAPPSSPASFLQSEPPSATQSPAGMLSLTSISANIYSPGPASIFAIGPYAHETQLVSPPVFSTFTTEPSTAPFTPPPESVHLTTPSSPEVPFAQLLDPNIRNGEAGLRFPLSHYEFQSYQLHPGSPVGQLISPNSGFSNSGTSSPFPDLDLSPGGPHFLEFRTGEPPKLLDLEQLSKCDWGSRRGSGSLTPDSAKPTSSDGFLLNTNLLDVAALRHSDSRSQNEETVVSHRVSFELTTEDVVRCVEKNPAPLSDEAASTSLKDASNGVVENCSGMVNGHECRVGGTSNDEPEKVPMAEEEEEEDVSEGEGHQKDRSITLVSVKEFNFDNAEGGDPHKSNIGSDWWANGKVAEEESGPTKTWSFFHMMQPGVS